MTYCRWAVDKGEEEEGGAFVFGFECFGLGFLWVCWGLDDLDDVGWFECLVFR